jgi:hypothetical protein
MKYFLIILFLLGFNVAFGTYHSQEINHFIVKENTLQDDKIAIIVSDSLQNSLAQINGTYNFSVNGFKQSLIFENGISVCPLQIEKSAFVFIKHINHTSNPSQLYFIYKQDKNLKPYPISWYLLLMIPIGLILIGYLFRKLIGIIILILVLLSYFNYSKGLSIPIFLESILDGLKNLF